ncbi:MAG TPA: hypothetical protein VF025_11855 [Gaiellaceae bacterium]
MRKLLLVLIVALSGPPTAVAGPGAARILYSSDWSGQTQIFAVDPFGRRPLAQLTFQRVPPCNPGSWAITCGLIDPLPAPDGRHIAYRSSGIGSTTLWVADADGRNAHIVATDLAFTDPVPGLPAAVWSLDSRRLRYTGADGTHVVRIDGSSVPNARGPWQKSRRTLRGYQESIFSPDRSRLAFADERGIGITNLRTGRTRVVAKESGFDLDWSADGKTLAYISGYLHFGTSQTGDLRVVSASGKVRTVVSSTSRYGGQITSLAWIRPPARARYRAARPVDGLYARGEVARLAADGTRVAFASCDNVYTWTAPASRPSLVDGNPLGATLCFPPTDRYQVYDLAVSGDVVAYARSYGGLTPAVELKLSPASSPAPVVAARGSTVLGGHMHGVGTLAGADGLLVFTAWDGRTAGAGAGAPPGAAIVTNQVVYRADGAACPCPVISSSPALEVPLDVEGRRIVVSHVFWNGGTWASRSASIGILDSTGTELLSLPVDTNAAQLSGSDLVVAVPGRLLDYDATNGSLRRSWPLPNAGVGRDCLFWSAPDCSGPYQLDSPAVALQDVARGLAAYTYEGRLHVLRLGDGVDTVVGYASEARFTSSGLVYADGARIHLLGDGY